jgi:hypothetical protein
MSKGILQEFQEIKNLTDDFLKQADDFIGRYNQRIRAEQTKKLDYSKLDIQLPETN